MAGLTKGTLAAALVLLLCGCAVTPKPIKQDAVPGLAIHMHFTPIAVGDYEIACAELCGLGHYKMHGIVKVVSQDDYDKWLAAREAAK